MNDLTSIDHTFTTKLTDIILANLANESFGVKELARETGMSSFNLNRKLHFISRKTINQYIREVRLRRAMEMLRQESVTASEVAFKVGFSSPAYFSTCFSEYFGYPPGEVKKRGLNSPVENGEGFSVEPVTIKQESVQTGTKPPGWNKQIRRAIVFASLSILFIIVIIYFFNNKNFGNFNFKADNRLKNQKRSIAVLPFINDSHDPENVYFINGVMEAILDNLSKIKDLEVRPRTSVEQYRKNGTKTIPQIARELGVNYIVEGSGQKIGDKVSLYIQLIETSSDKHLFSNRYNMKLEDIFNLQSEVAIKVASEIKAVITIEEKELIEEPPTASLAAWEMYSRGFELHNIAQLEDNMEFDHKAEVFLKRAIHLDSTYADPYVQLGWIRLVAGELDSASFYANRALYLDDKNPRCHALNGRILQFRGLEEEAEEAYRFALKYSPNYYPAYRFLGELYFQQGDCFRAIENQLKAFHLENNSFQERNNLISLCSSLYSLGFYKEGQKYADKLFQLTSDSTYYYFGLQSSDLDHGNYESALESALKMYTSDTTYVSNIWNLGYTYLYLRNFRESFRLMNKYTEIMKQQGRKIEPNYLLGWVYLENGYKKEAGYHLEGSKNAMLKIIEQKQPSESCIAYLNLTKIYSVRNEKAKALENLRKAKSLLKFTVFRIKDFNNCTMLDNIRQEPEFAEFIKEAEARYLKEHEKVEKLLSQEGILISSLK